MIDLPDDPLAQAQHLIAAARHDFARDVDALLIEIRAMVDAFPEDHFTRLTRYEAWGRLRQLVIDRFDQPARTLEVALLRQLVREADDALNNPETLVDIRDWTKAAAPFVRSGG